MIFYLDTSLIVSALTPEARTVEVQAWMRKQAAGALVTSEWTVTEFSAALSSKVRTGALDHDGRIRILAEWAKLTTGEMTILPIDNSLFRIAARLADRVESGVRAGDALHLAIAAGAGLELVTLDQGQARAGLEMGLRTYLLD